VRVRSLEGKPWGITSLFDAIEETARLVGERSNKHRALLVVTDGVDTGSKLTPAQVSGVASSIDVPVYLLAVVNPANGPGTAALSDYMAGIAQLTGAGVKVVGYVHTSYGQRAAAELVEAVRDILTELRFQHF
jgi:hypothetical protein